MTFDQLRTFFWVAKLQGFRRAAEKLHLSQPAVSTRISNLEAELKIELFHRGPGTLSLTKKGQQLLLYAEQILYVEEEVKNRIASSDETVGLLRVGVSETIAQAWLPQFIEALAQEFPKVSVDLTVDISYNLRSLILDQHLDVAFLMGPISEYSIDNVPLPQFDLHWYRPRDIDQVDLRQMPIVSYSARTRPHRELMTQLAHHVGPKMRVFSSASLSASLKLISSGIAVGPFPKILAEPYLKSGEVCEFDPGISLSPLEFTASYLSAPRSFLAEKSAEIAQSVARKWHGMHPQA